MGASRPPRTRWPSAWPARHPEGPWEKYPHNPVFKPTGNEKDFDGIYLQHAWPVKVGDPWRLYYNGWTFESLGGDRGRVRRWPGILQQSARTLLAQGPY